MELKEIKYEFYKCDECVYRDMIPGNAHIQCTFDWIGALGDMTVPYFPIGIVHGIRNNWYDFPFQFDPTWMAMPCPAFHDKSLAGEDVPEIRKNDETIRIVISLQFRQRGMNERIKEEDFNKIVEKYNEVMKNLDTADSD